MKTDYAFIGWQISQDEKNILIEIKNNYRFKTVSQVLYELIYNAIDINSLLIESRIFADKQKTNSAKN